MTAVPGSGACVLRVRRAPAGYGWQVLIRLSPRPLSVRPWRVAGFPGALNATVAAAAVRMSRPRRTDRVLNLMCGSGTLLVERLLICGAAHAAGVDHDREVLRASDHNLSAAGVREHVQLHLADVNDGWAGQGSYDVIFADPPWGDKVRTPEDAFALHRMLLHRAAELATPKARLVIITHRVKIMRRCLAEPSGRWRLIEEKRVWAKGHHPRIYLLHRQDNRPLLANYRP